MSETDPRMSPGSYANIEPGGEASTIRKQLPDTPSNTEAANNLRKELWHANEAAPWTIAGIYSSLKQQAPDAPVAIEKDSSGKEYLYLSDAFTKSPRQNTGTLFSTKEDPLMSINALSASKYAQTSAFQESLVAVAARAPETLLNSIKQNDDGSVAVNFPGAKNEPITVTANQLSQAAEKNIHAPERDGFRGTWPLAFMEAYKQYRKNHGDSAATSNQDFWKSDVGVDRTVDALKLLTGKDVEQERMRYGMIPVSRTSTIANLLKNQEKNHLPSIMYDEGYKTARAVWNYDPQEKEVWSTLARRVDYDMTGIHPRFMFDPQVLIYVK
jgi:hypothetical protein